MRSFLIIPLFFLIFPMAKSQSITIYEWEIFEQSYTSKKAKEGEIKGGRIVSMSPPEDYPGVLNFKDWLLHIFLK